MNALLAIPMEVRLAIVFVFGVCLGSLVNLGAYRLAYKPRRIGPWGAPDKKAPPRRFVDRVPVIGWLTLRRESVIHGRRFWVRPPLVELLLGVALAGLYWWEIGCRGLLPPMAEQEIPVWVYTILHAQFAAHVILILLMLVASLIDLDELMIPPVITTCGTLIGLLLAAVFPWSLLPNLEARCQDRLHYQQAQWEAGHKGRLGELVAVGPHTKEPLPTSGERWPFLLLTSVEGPRAGKPWQAALWDPQPNQPPPWGVRLDGSFGLLLGLACWWAWCLVEMPWTWYSNHGWRKAAAMCWARLIREKASCYVCLAIGAIGSAGVVAAWLLGTWYWMGLLTALVGVVVGGGIVWGVRIIGSATLQREAMGFGDVMLVAMMGAFLGWQACLLIFFLAPLAGLAIKLATFSSEREFPYGPYLCLAAFVLIVFWAPIWNQVFLTFEAGWLVPLLGFACFGLMAPLLMLMRTIREAIEG